MPLSAALLLAALLAIPASNIAQAQAPPGNELTLVNADREFVERKGGGEFVARPVFDREIASLFYAVRDADTGDWISAMYRVKGGEKKRRHVATEHGMRRYNRPEDEWVGVPFPPLVDEETWQQTKEAKKRRLTRSGRNTKVFYLLQHLVRCAECGFLMGCRANKRDISKGKDHIYVLDTPRLYYSCYGMLTEGLKCRERSHIRAERLEGVVWGEVKKVMENPGLIVASIEALDAEAEDGGLADEIAKAERDLQKIQMEEDRAIRLFVSGKITEKQLDHQRRFITERLETLRATLDGHSAREMEHADKRALAEHIFEWARRAGDKLDSLSDKGRREVLELLLDGATIDRNNNVNLTLAIPTEDVVSIARRSAITASTPCGRRRGGHGASDRPGPSRSCSWPTGEPSRRMH